MNQKKVIKIERDTWLILAIFIVTACLSWMLFLKSYAQQDTVSVQNFPRQIGAWQGVDLTISNDEYALFETHNVFKREYTDANGRAVYLMIIYSQHNRKVSQPPEICYLGSRASIFNNEHAYVDVKQHDFVIKANKLLLEAGGTQQIMYYWFKVGKDTFTANYWKQQAIIAAKTIVGKPVGSALIRVSATIGPEGINETSKRIDDFVLQMTPLLFKALP